MEKNRLEAFSDGVLAIIITIMVSYPTSFAPISIYFAYMALACFTFHQLYFLILQGERKETQARCPQLQYQFGG